LSPRITLDELSEKHSSLDLRVDRLETEVGRTRTEGLRGAVHSLSAIPQAVLATGEKVLDLEKKHDELSTAILHPEKGLSIQIHTMHAALKTWGKVVTLALAIGGVLVPIVVVALEHWLK